MRSEICLESWWELRTIMLCNVAGCWGMLITIAPTLKTAALLVLSPRWALYNACDLAMLHFTTVLKDRGNTMTKQTGIQASVFFFIWWGYLDGCKTLKHHANPLFRVQVSTQNSDTMNELQWFCTTDNGLLVCKKYFSLVPVKIFSAFLQHYKVQHVKIFWLNINSLPYCDYLQNR